ncbi:MULTISPECIES: hypothetical protein [Actinoalloteichus]|uniref:hypothetical protein n=1 Tax=Actinoalloteichus TaxID=65496 RepID=UPI001E2F1C73|nr:MULTISPECIES: hypothetical protein [Actinoalloteichus]
MEDDDRYLGRPPGSRQISDTVGELGWRYVLAGLHTYVRVVSLTEAAELVRRIVAGTDGDADGHLSADLRRDRLILTLRSPATESVTQHDVDLAHRISALVAGVGLRTDAQADAAERGPYRCWNSRSTQSTSHRSARSGRPSSDTGTRQRTAAPRRRSWTRSDNSRSVWFQQMTEPRPQRNRIDLDISVPHDEARRRMDDVDRDLIAVDVQRTTSSASRSRCARCATSAGSSRTTRVTRRGRWSSTRPRSSVSRTRRW